MDTTEKVILIEWCIEKDYRVLGIYHDKPRIFWAVSVWDRGGGWYLSAHDSTHGGDEYTRTYHVEELVILGISRRRPVKVALLQEEE